LIRENKEYLEVRRGVEGSLGRKMDAEEKQIVQQMLREKHG
jgi:hypothetical protein